MKKSFVSVIGRGGVGKSIIAKELACCIASRQQNGFSEVDNTRVLLIDTNFGYSTQASINDVADLRFDFRDLVNDHRKLATTRDEYLKLYDWNYLQKYLAYNKKENIYILCVSKKRNKIDPQVLSNPEATTIYMALSKFFDVVIVDCNNGWGGEVFSSMTQASCIVFVNEDTTLSHDKILEVRRRLIDRGYDGLLTGNSVLVCNKVDPEHTFMPPEWTSQRLDLPLAVEIPLLEAGDMICSFSEPYPLSPVTPKLGRPIYKLASGIISEEIPYHARVPEQ